MARTVRVHLIIHGLVQGVWFRKHAAEEARRSGLAGYVRNLPDGSVEAEAEGEADAVDRFVQWCGKGPPLARVQQVQVSPRPVIGQAGFAVVR